MTINNFKEFENSPLNVTVSYYTNIKQVTGTKFNLLEFLNDSYLIGKVLEFRKLEEGPDREAAKKNIPSITPSGLFRYRNTGSIDSYTKLLQFDIDYKDNLKIPMSEIKEIVCSFENVAFCGYSLSGKGIWGVIPVEDPAAHHKQYFELISDVFASQGIIIDKSGSDITRLRLASYDEAPYYNHEAKVLTVFKEKIAPAIVTAAQPQQTNYYKDPAEDEKLVRALISLICKVRIDITGSYNAWYSLGCFFANRYKYNESQGQEYFHLISQFHDKYNVQDTNTQFKACRRSSSKCNIGTLMHFCKAAGITRASFLVCYGDEFETIG